MDANQGAVRRPKTERPVWPVSRALARLPVALILLHGLAATAAALLLALDVGAAVAVPWGAAMLAALALRFIRGRAHDEPGRLLPGVLATGVLWGVLWWLLPEASLAARWHWIGLFSSVMIGVGLILSVLHPPSFVVGMLAALLPLSLRLLMGGQTWMPAVGALVLVEAAVACGLAFVVHAGFRRAALTGRENFRLLRRLGRRSTLLEAVFEGVDQGVVVFDAAGRLLALNRRAERLWRGIGPLGTGLPIDAFRADGLRHARPALGQAAAEGHGPADGTDGFEIDRPEGGGLDLRFRAMTGGGAVATLTDLGARRRSEAAIWNMAHHDALTGLPNRTLFRRRLGLALDEAEGEDGVGLLVLDIDRFKAINDTLGHPAGDRFLRLVAARLRATAGHDATVTRLGGDEFAVILPGLASPDEAAEAASRVIEALRRPALVDGLRLHAGGSIGIGIGPSDGRDPDELLRAADIALHSAKAKGGDAYAFFTPELSRAALARHRLERALPDALERGEIRLDYQPQYGLKERRIVGVEALLRWDHPEIGAVDTSELVRVAEITGRIRTLGAWVLRTACEQAVRWRADGLGPLRVAVNLSAMQLPRQDVAGLVTRVLRDTGLPPEALELELTETSVMESASSVATALARLRAMGVGLALDDFGTGYASFAYLRRFTFDALKIDRSFVADLDQPDAAAIVQTSIDLGRRLGLRVIAEGVETEAQLERLRLMGCDEIQGYVISPPIRAASVGPLLVSLEPRALAG